MVIGAPRPPRATTVSPKLKWPYGGYHNGLEHNLEWRFSEVIGFFIQIIFKYLQKLETFFQKTFVFKLHICFCLSHLLGYEKNVIIESWISDGEFRTKDSFWDSSIVRAVRATEDSVVPFWHFELECEVYLWRKFSNKEMSNAEPDW